MCRDLRSNHKVILYKVYMTMSAECSVCFIISKYYITIIGYNTGDLGSVPGLALNTGNSPIFLPGESPGMAEPGGLQSLGSRRAGYNRATKHSRAQPRLFPKIFLRISLH